MQAPNLVRLKKLLYWLAPHGLILIHEKRRRTYAESDLRRDFRLPVAELTELFPGIGGLSVQLTPDQFYRPPSMVLPLSELLTLMALCRYLSPKRLFEMGTFRGDSSLAMARSTAEDARIWTLDIESQGPHLAFCGQPEEAKVRVLIGDSRTFDFGPYVGQCDFVFVDADHTHAAALRDTETAFRLVKPGGIILWDDYVFDPRYPECSGVKLVLEELGRPDVFQLGGTRFAICRG